MKARTVVLVSVLLMSGCGSSVTPKVSPGSLGTGSERRSDGCETIDSLQANELLAAETMSARNALFLGCEDGGIECFPKMEEFFVSRQRRASIPTLFRLLEEHR
jgi:hypothetical protein